MSTFHSKTPDLDTVTPAQFNWIITLTLAMCCTSSVLRSSQAKFMTSVCVCVCASMCDLLCSAQNVWFMLPCRSKSCEHCWHCILIFGNLALFEPPLVYLNCVYGDCDDEDSKLSRTPDLLFSCHRITIIIIIIRSRQYYLGFKREKWTVWKIRWDH